MLREGEIVREEHLINASERDTDTPANDEDKLMRLEDNGHLDFNFPEHSVQEIFNDDGTWEKPENPTASFAFVECWAGGGSGASAKGNNSISGANGGGGGEYRSSLIPLFLLPSSVSVTIGIGGAAVSRGIGSPGVSVGNAGGDTTFGSLVTAKGGLGGTGYSGSGSTHGSVAAVTNSSGSSPAILAPTEVGGGIESWNTSTVTPASPTTPVYSGGAGGGAVTGGGDATSNGATPSSGTSGKGGDGVASSGSGTFVAENGAVPSGGGGGTAAENFVSNISTSGNGAKGRVRVTVF